MKIELGKKIDQMGDWFRTATVDGVVYYCGHKRGKRVRIAFKPRGQNIGFHYYGSVRTKEGRELFYGRVSKSIGVRGLLKLAGVIDDAPADNEEMAQ